MKYSQLEKNLYDEYVSAMKAVFLQDNPTDQDKIRLHNIRERFWKAVDDGRIPEPFDFDNDRRQNAE